MVAGNVDKFCSYAQGAALVVGEARRPGHAHPALAHAGIQQLIHVCAGLGQNVLAYDADVCRAVLDVNRNVAGLDEEVPHTGVGVLDHELAGVVVVLGGAVARASQQLVRLVAEATLRQGDVQPAFLAALLLHGGQRRGQAFQLV